MSVLANRKLQPNGLDFVADFRWKLFCFTRCARTLVTLDYWVAVFFPRVNLNVLLSFWPGGISIWVLVKPWPFEQSLMELMVMCLFGVVSAGAKEDPLWALECGARTRRRNASVFVLWYLTISWWFWAVCFPFSDVYCGYSWDSENKFPTNSSHDLSFRVSLSNF